MMTMMLVGPKQLSMLTMMLILMMLMMMRKEQVPTFFDQPTRVSRTSLSTECLNAEPFNLTSDVSSARQNSVPM